MLLSAICLFMVGTSQAQIKTPAPSPSSKTEQMIGLTTVSLDYSRPAMRGRVIFGNLVPFGKTWRTGANANTKITFSTDATVAGTKLKKGTYAVYTVPNKNSWDVIFYSDAKNWGTPAKWDDTKVAAKATVTTSKVNKTESFTMAFSNLSNDAGSLDISWENTQVSVKVEVPTNDIALKSIKKAMNGPSVNDYFSAASFYHETGKDLNKALEWITKATEGENPRFWMMRRKSLIQADMGDYKGAIKSANVSLKGAEKQGNADYVKMNTESIASWKNK